MASLGLHNETAPNDEIAVYYSDVSHVPLGGAPYGNTVVKPSEKSGS